MQGFFNFFPQFCSFNSDCLNIFETASHGYWQFQEHLRPEERRHTWCYVEKKWRKDMHQILSRNSYIGPSYRLTEHYPAFNCWKPTSFTLFSYFSATATDGIFERLYLLWLRNVRKAITRDSWFSDFGQRYSSMALYNPTFYTNLTSLLKSTRRSDR